MKVLITGANGQVGRALLSAAPAGFELVPVTHAQLDIGDEDAAEAFVLSRQPQIIINTAAYTAVDRAESERDAAARVNAAGPGYLARAADRVGARLIHFSTDFVFDGRKSTPYRIDDETGPLSVYGETKLAGERAVLAALPYRSLIMRTSWVYAAAGQNFVRTMTRLMRERGSVRVIADQIGTPTAAHSIASAVWKAISLPALAGVHHWTDAGIASWYDFAVAIAEEAIALGLLSDTVRVLPIATHEYPTPAKRPAFSVLDKADTFAALGLVPPHWRTNLRQVLTEMERA